MAETTKYLGRRHPKWRVVARWAQWHRGGLLRHLTPEERDDLSQFLGAYVKDDRLEARLEIAEVMLTVGADAAATVAAFHFDSDVDMNETSLRDAKDLAAEMRTLRTTGLWRPIVSEKKNPVSFTPRAWVDLDASAAVRRRAVALKTRDARALLAELAALLVLLRRSSEPALAVQAIHIHLPLAELMKNAQMKQQSVEKRPPFQPGPYAALVREIEDRASAALFPVTYNRLRSMATRATAIGGDDEFARRARQLLADRLAKHLGPDIADRLLVTARVKTPASAMRKMLRRTATVHDVLGLRVVLLPRAPIPFLQKNSSSIVPKNKALHTSSSSSSSSEEEEEEADDDDDIRDLYSIYDAAVDVWPELEGRYKDYVRHPKPNGYQSLHTTVWIGDVPMEIQIRTLSMHTVAETGVASHALYSGLRRDAALANELLDQPLHQRRLLSSAKTSDHPVSVDEVTASSSPRKKHHLVPLKSK